MFLGLDLGTSGLRALLVGQDGEIIASAEAGYPIAHPHPGWSEQNPADWVSACTSTIKDLNAHFKDEMSKLKAIGVSGQMHGATLLDSGGAVLRPCILWNDTRSHKEAKALDGAEGVRALSGNIVFPGFTAPKLVWVARNEPEIFAKTAKVLLPKDYLNYWLTGQYFSDMSDSAGTAWLDVGAREWSDKLLAQSGMKRSQMPALFEGCEAGGTLRTELAAEWGVSPETIVVAGGGDNAVAACGMGALDEGDAFVSLGTSGVLLTAKSAYTPMPETAVHTFCHAIPGRWYQMGVTLAATDSLNWLSRNLGAAPEALSANLGERLSGPGQVQFLPYLSGERTPHNDSSIRGAFLNIDIGDGQNQLTQAVMEGVAFSLRDSYEALKSTGTKLSRVTAIGGGSKSRYWVELLATILNMPVDIPEKGDFGAALGAARLAIVGATGAEPQSVMTKPAIETTLSPRSDLLDEYEAAYQAWHKIYPAIKALK